MYFSAEAIKSAYRLLVQLDPKDEGKSRQEKVSALRHLLATSLSLKKLQATSLDLAVSNQHNRDEFKRSVGEIVAISGTSKYTVDFADKFADDLDYGVGSNFLTTRVKESRSGKHITYPGRPAPVLDIINEKITILDNTKEILERDYNLTKIRTPLAVWLLRAENVSSPEVTNPDQLDELQKLIAAAIISKFETSVANSICPSKDELTAFVSQSGLKVQSLLGQEKAAQASVVAMHSNGISPPVEQRSNIINIVAQCHSDLSAAGLICPEELIHRYISSLLAKRFLILTGLSGSGKTKIAHAFAAWLSESEDQYRLIAVGADWTTNENVVGYQDALQTGIYRKPSNGALDLILRASNDPVRPYFLILDEMNLSHVERYFADILSAVESGQEIALHSAAESLKCSEDDPLPVPSRIRLPDNLFIVGTVNVDETTYMFSPKVLDRANVVEFRATAEDIAAFLDAPAAVKMDALAGKGAIFGPAFVAESRADSQLESATAADLKARLAEIFGALAPIGAEFGFRTAYEITRFIHFHAKLAGSGWQFKDALDAQVLQKLLPKLHGSERRLRPVLEALETFCVTHQCAASLEKIRRMQDRLKDGFTSFAEA
ncbi:MAG: McrB family protein [Desulfobulbia bacterium]